MIVDHLELKEDLYRIQRSLERVHEYSQHLPVLEPVSGDVACLEEMIAKWRHLEDAER